MSIYTDKRTGIKYISYIDPTGKRVRKSLGTKNSNVATIKAANVVSRKDTLNSDRVYFDAFLARYRAYLSATRKPATASLFELAIKKLFTIKKVKFLDEVTPALLDEVAVSFKAKIAGANAPGLNRSIRALKTAMRQAEFWDLIPPQNWRKVSKFKEIKGRVEFHTPEEIKQLLKYAPSDQWRLVILLGSRAGMRRGEIGALKWADIDFSKHSLYIAPNKTEKGRNVPIPADLLSALKKELDDAKNEYVINIGKIARNSQDYLSAAYRNWTMDAHLPFTAFLHKLRHTYASHLVQNGVDLYRVSKLLGHSSIRMTEIYAHLAPQDLADAVQKLPKI